MAPYQVQPIQVSDAAGLALTTMSAFYTDPHWLLLWPSVPLAQIIAANTLRQPHSLTQDRPHRRFEKAVDAASGDVVGYARWIVPDGFEGMWAEAQVAEPSTEEEKGRFRRMYESAEWNPRSDMGAALSPAMEDAERGIVEGKRFLTLDYLATRPDHMGKGVASLLVQSGLEQADKVGLETIVMAKNASVGLYRRLGFALVKTVVQDDSMFGGNGAYTVHFMVRPVKGQMVVQREAETVGRA